MTDPQRDHTKENQLFYQFLRKSKFEDLAGQLSKINNLNYQKLLSGGIPFNDSRIYSRNFQLVGDERSAEDLQLILEGECPLKFAQSSLKKAEIRAFNSGKDKRGMPPSTEEREKINCYGNPNWLSWLQFCFERVASPRQTEDSIIFAYVTGNVQKLMEYSGNQFERVYWAIYGYLHHTILKKYFLVRKLLQERMVLFTEEARFEKMFFQRDLSQIWQEITNPVKNGENGACFPVSSPN